jgi:heme/copper-type cytochrome/quinol oxidase subunit 2
MKHDITTGVHLILDWFDAIPIAWFYGFGFLVGASALTFIVVNWFKNSHLRREGEKLSKRVVEVALYVSAFIIYAAGQVIQFGDFAQFLPHVQALGWVIAFAGTIYRLGGNKAYVAVTDKLHAWIGKKPKRFTDNLPELPVPADLDVHIAAVKAPVPPEAPSNKLLQL